MKTRGRTLVCSVLFLDIADYSKGSVSEQLRQKEALNRLLANALGEIDAHSRVIIDTGDGAAIVFLGAPEDALFVATALREMASGSLAMRMGINLGPVRMMKDLNGRTSVVGDGINDAQRVMCLADPGHLMVSRPFNDVVSRLSSAYENLFTFQGSHRDKHRRSHHVYSVAPGVVVEGRVPDPAVASDHIEDRRTALLPRGDNLPSPDVVGSPAPPYLVRLLIFFSVDAILAVAAYWLATIARFGRIPSLSLEHVVTGTGLAAILMPTIALALGFYRSVTRFQPDLVSFAAIVSGLCGAVLATIALHGGVRPLQAIGFGLVFALLYFVFLLLSRAAARRIYRASRSLSTD